MAYTEKTKIDNEHLGAEIIKLGAHVNSKVVAAQANNATANASTQTASYVQADVTSIVTLANALKADFNGLLDKLRTAGLMV